MDLSWLRQIAPTVATALAGPLAGMAVEVISKAIGVPHDDVQSMIESGKLSSEQLAQLKLAELELKKQAQSLGLDFEKLSVEDKSSARNMQTATRSKVPPILAFMVTFGFFGILGSIMAGYAQKSDELMIMLGSLSTAWTGVMAFYFGSSSGSQKKDVMLYQSVPADKAR